MPHSISSRNETQIRHTVICLNCGRSIKTTPTRANTQKFCNRECESVHRARYSPAKTFVCKECKSEFSAYTNKRNFCSMECRRINKEKNLSSWVTRYGLAFPYGECQCGCGEKTSISKYTRPERFQVAGEYLRFVERHGSRNNLETKFWENVDRGDENSCWIWKGSAHPEGYGLFRVNRATIYSHRASYELHLGSIPKGMHVLHKCDNPSCCNPNHLFLGTNLDNIQDKVQKGRQPKGTSHHNARWTEDDIRAMRRLYSEGMSQRQIARLFSTDQSAIGYIVTRKAWRHIE